MASSSFHNAYTDNVDVMNSAGFEGTSTLVGLSSLDAAIGKQGGHAFAMATGPILQDIATSTVYYPIMHAYHHHDVTGSITRNLIAAGSIVLTNSSTVGQAAYVVLSETQGGTGLTVVAADYSSILVTLMKDRTKMVLFARPPIATGVSPLHMVGIRPSLPLQGEVTLTATTTTTAVGSLLLPHATKYNVILQQTVVGGTPLKPYVQNASKSATGFTITHDAATAGDKIFWMIQG